MNVLLASIGRRSYLAKYFRDALATCGVVVGTNCVTDAPGLFAVDVPLIVPSAHKPDYIPTMLRICRDWKIDLLFSLHDVEVMVLANHLASFRDTDTQAVIPNAASCNVCLDKYAGYRFLVEHGLPAPVTCLGASEAELRIASGELGLPVVIKPRCGSGSNAQFTTDDRASVSALCKYAELAFRKSPFAPFMPFGEGDGVLVQELVQGEEYGLNVINDLEGNHVTSLVLRKLGMRSGETDAAETVVNPVVADLGRQLGTILRHVGVLDVDVIMRGGTPHVLDMNPRFGGQYPFWHAAGANIPAALLAWHKGELPNVDWLTPRPGVCHFKEIVVRRFGCEEGGHSAAENSPDHRRQ